MKILLVVLDGLGDRPAPELGYKTPLEAAATPHLDRLAEIGMNGQFYSMMPGVAPATDLAHFVMFGYDLADYPGRAIMEAISQNIKLENNMLLMRARFVRVSEENDYFTIEKRSIDSIGNDIAELAKSVGLFESQGVTLELKHIINEQANIIIRGQASHEITDSDPLVEGLPVAKVIARAEAKEPELARRTAEAVNDFLIWAYEKLSASEVNKRRIDAGLEPINFVLTKWSGCYRELETFEDKWGLRGALVGMHPAIHGLAVNIGMRFVKHTDRNDPELDLSEQFEHADDLFSEGFDFVVIHSKAADDAAHQKKPALKRDVIEKLDRAFDALYSMPSLTEDLLFVVTADHSTPSCGPLIHSGEPVPIAIAGSNQARDDVEVFAENACYKGCLGRMTGSELIPLLLTLTDRVKYSGSRVTSKDRIYLPKVIEPLRIPEQSLLARKSK